MFAVIKTGGKQYKVAKGDTLKIEKIEGNAGDTVILDNVIAIGDDKGVTLGDNVKQAVAAEILEQKKDKKLLVFKKKRRQNYRRKHGHRQHVSIIKIADIGENLKPSKAKAVKDTRAEEKPQAKAKPQAKEAKPVETKAAAKPEAKKTSAKPAAKKAPAKPAKKTSKKD